MVYNHRPMSISATRNPNLTAPLKLIETSNTVQKEFLENWWTGLPPEKCKGFDFEKKYLQALPLLNLDICTRQDVLDYFDNTWTLTELLFQSLKSSDVFTRAPYHQLRHPLIFYYGHTAVLFINKLRLAGLVEKPLDLYLEKVLETGVDEMSWDDLSKNEMLWPSISEIHKYRKKTYEVIKEIILNHPAVEKRVENKLEHPLWALWMGFEHEKIHFETSSVLMRELPIELVETPKYWAPLHPSFKTKNESQDSSSNLNWIEHDQQKVNLGKPSSEKSFGWDNEYGQRSVQLKKFKVTEKLISNKDFLEFVKSGGYTQDQHWSEEGLLWRKFRNTKRPTFWMAAGPEGLHDYKLRTIFEVIDLPLSWPVEVNHHEAQAFCDWKQKKDQSNLTYRLLTEAEFNVVRGLKQKDIVLQSKSYSDTNPNEDKTINFNLKWSSPSPVDSTAPGNVWHLIEDQFNPLDGFNVHPLYDDFSTPCFDGKHYMILGGSFISCGHEASHWARFHFRPHFYQHSGFRMAATADGTDDNQSFKFSRQQNYSHQKRHSVLDQMSSNENWFKNIEQPLDVSNLEIEKLFELTDRKILDFQKKFKTMKASGTVYDAAKNTVSDDFKVTYQTSKNFPTYGQNYVEQLNLIFDELAPFSHLPGHPGYAAYVAGSANIYSQLAQLISAHLNPYTAHYMMAPGFVTLEAEAIRWFLNLFKYPSDQATGYFTTGGSQANLIALSMARKTILKTSDLNKARVYTSKQSHHCIAKALDFLGFPLDTLQKVKVQKDLKIDLQDLEEQILRDLKNGLTPFAIVGTAGSTNTGAVDNLEQIHHIAKKYNLWFHVDGAYGALFMMTAKGSEILKGIEWADSIAFDPHKALCLPYGTGGLLIRDQKNIQFNYTASSTYMPPSPDNDDRGLQIDYADLTHELSRDWRGLRVWLPIKALGIEPFILNLEEKFKLTDWLQNQIKDIPNLKIFQEAQLTVSSFYVVGQSKEESNQKTQKMLEWINNSNVLFLSSCTIDEQKVIRVCLLGHQLHFERVEQFVKQLKEFAQKIETE